MLRLSESVNSKANQGFTIQLYSGSTLKTRVNVRRSNAFSSQWLPRLLSVQVHKRILQINWSWLSRNKNAIHLLKKNLDKINWVNLSFNKNYDKKVASSSNP